MRNVREATWSDRFIISPAEITGTITVSTSDLLKLLHQPIKDLRLAWGLRSDRLNLKFTRSVENSAGTPL